MTPQELAEEAWQKFATTARECGIEPTMEERLTFCSGFVRGYLQAVEQTRLNEAKAMLAVHVEGDGFEIARGEKK